MFLLLYYLRGTHSCGILMPRYSWNTAKVGIKQQSINQSINHCGILQNSVCLLIFKRRIAYHYSSLITLILKMLLALFT